MIEAGDDDGRARVDARENPDAAVLRVPDMHDAQPRRAVFDDVDGRRFAVSSG